MGGIRMAQLALTAHAGSHYRVSGYVDHEVAVHGEDGSWRLLSRFGVLDIELPGASIKLRPVTVHLCCDLIKALESLRDELVQAEIDEALGDGVPVEQ